MTGAKSRFGGMKAATAALAILYAAAALAVLSTAAPTGGRQALERAPVPASFEHSPLGR